MPVLLVLKTSETKETTLLRCALSIAFASGLGALIGVVLAKHTGLNSWPWMILWILTGGFVGFISNEPRKNMRIIKKEFADLKVRMARRRERRLALRETRSMSPQVKVVKQKPAPPAKWQVRRSLRYQMICWNYGRLAVLFGFCVGAIVFWITLLVIGIKVLAGGKVPDKSDFILVGVICSGVALVMGITAVNDPPIGAKCWIKKLSTLMEKARRLNAKEWRRLRDAHHCSQKAWAQGKKECLQFISGKFVAVMFCYAVALVSFCALWDFCLLVAKTCRRISTFNNYVAAIGAMVGIIVSHMFGLNELVGLVSGGFTGLCMFFAVKFLPRILPDAGGLFKEPWCRNDVRPKLLKWEEGISAPTEYA